MKEIVLIIDDNPVSIFMHRILIKKTYGEVLIGEYATAEAALQFLKEIKNPDVFQFTIFLDVYMPGMSGWDFLNELEKNSKLNYKAHLISLSRNPEDKLKSKNYQSVFSYIEKPLTANKMKEFGLSA